MRGSLEPERLDYTKRRLVKNGTIYYHFAIDLIHFFVSCVPPHFLGSRFEEVSSRGVLGLVNYEEVSSVGVLWLMKFEEVSCAGAPG